MEKKVEAISVKELIEKKKMSIPYFVIEAVNKLLEKEFDGKRAVILQEDILNEIRVHMSTECSRSMVFENHWLDFEDLYRDKGWKVEYDKPGLGESYKARFIFKC